LIRFVPEVGSTNDDLAARLAGAEHVPEGEWLVAERQVAGRGRSGREWFDGAGNFMGSTVVHARFGDPALHTLALVTGLAVRETVAACLPEPHRAVLKWPNDVLVGNAKLAGILLESARDSVIVGVGVNLVAAPIVPGRATIALADFTMPPPRDDFARELARQFDLELSRWRDFGLAPMVRRWTAAAHGEGTTLNVDAAGERIAGVFEGLADDGALRLRLADGSLRVIHAGEVTLADGR
jgi:BirA family biotin operon repressor/biotin-[acetyl-CoA-carboxylase] ligase